MIHLNHPEHGRQIMQSIDSDFSSITMTVISRSEEGACVGGVIYENWSGPNGSVLVHIAGFDKHWINRDMLYAMFDYPFRQLDCFKAFCHVRSSLTDVIQFNKKFGWKEITTLTHVYPNDDMVLMEMNRADCRYLNVKPKAVFSNKKD